MLAAAHTISIGQLLITQGPGSIPDFDRWTILSHCRFRASGPSSPGTRLSANALASRWR
jgi:hypothetical protein